MPVSVKIRNTALIPSASTMFCTSRAWVLRDRRMNRGQFAQVVIHQGHVSSLDGCAGTGRTHGKADV